MAPFYILLLLLLVNSSHSLSSPIISLPTSKHPETHHHITLLFHTPLLSPTPLLLHLTSPFLSLPSPSPPSSVFLSRLSLPCSAASSSSSHSAHLCTLSFPNPISHSPPLLSHLVHDVVAINNRLPPIDEFVYVSAPANYLTGLGSPVQGVLGLGRNRVGVAQQVTHSFGLSKKFSVCLSSSLERNGVVLFGDNQRLSDVADSMVYTPMLNSDKDGSYRINLKSVNVRNKKLPLHQLSCIKFSTVDPYTLVKPELYKQIIEAFSTEAEHTGMTRASSIGQFELCYDSVKDVTTVPIIDLVLQSEMVKWRIYGPNSMVKVNDTVMCLGIMEGGEELDAEIVLGSHQLEDNLVEFDLGRSMIGFSSLVMKSTKCEHLSSLVHQDDVQSF